MKAAAPPQKPVEKAEAKKDSDEEEGGQKAKVEKTESDYSADWGDNDLEDKGAAKAEVKQVAVPQKT